MLKFVCFYFAMLTTAAQLSIAQSTSVQSGSSLPAAATRVEVEMKKPQEDWMDQSKTIADLLAPAITAIFGIWILIVTKRLDRTQWRDQKLVEKRIEVWDKVGPRINEIYCYCRRIGRWKEFTPPDVVLKKREADQQMHLSRPYFSAEFFESYQAFVHACFKTFQGHGEDAKLKTNIDEHRNVRKWDPTWDRLFHNVPASDAELDRHYEGLIKQACRDFGV